MPYKGKNVRMETNTPWHIFFKSYQNQASPDEIMELKRWLGADEENIKLLGEVYNVISVSSGFSQRINPDIRSAWEKVDRATSKKLDLSRNNKGVKHRVYYLVAAAIILIGLFMVGIINHSNEKGQIKDQYTEVVTLPGQRVSIILPDSTKIWLNSSSTLRYSSDFNRKEREVILTGEGFFEVSKDKSKRFRVVSGGLNIDVYGTSFNVKNYSDEKSQEVTVKEGLVGVSESAKVIGRLTGGERVTVDKESGDIEISKGNFESIAAWKDNELSFRNTPVKEVIETLESWYGVKIKIDSQMIGHHNYTFKIKTESLREVLNRIKLMTPIEYEINGQNVEIKYINQ